MALAIMYEWIVTINERFKYQVTAPFCAEAQHLAAMAWRRDRSVPAETRRERITVMHTEELIRVEDLPPTVKAMLRDGKVLVSSGRPQARHVPQNLHQRQGELRALCNKKVVAVAAESVARGPLPVCAECGRRAAREAPVGHGSLRLSI